MSKKSLIVSVLVLLFLVTLLVLYTLTKEGSSDYQFTQISYKGEIMNYGYRYSDVTGTSVITGIVDKVKTTGDRVEVSFVIDNESDPIGISFDPTKTMFTVQNQMEQTDFFWKLYSDETEKLIKKGVVVTFILPSENARTLDDAKTGYLDNITFAIHSYISN